jgi:hypothetical protein
LLFPWYLLHSCFKGSDGISFYNLAENDRDSRLGGKGDPQTDRRRRIDVNWSSTTVSICTAETSVVIGVASSNLLLWRTLTPSGAGGKEIHLWPACSSMATTHRFLRLWPGGQDRTKP